MTHSTLLTQLIEAHRTGTEIEDVRQELRPAPLDDAYAIADEFATVIGKPVVGWKIGAAGPRGQQMLKLNEPFVGRVFEDTLLTSPATLPTHYGTLTIGAEYALRVARDLGPNETNFDEQSIVEVVDGIFPSFELNWASYRDPFGLGGLLIIADNGFNIGLALGESPENWRELNVASISVRFWRDDQEPIVGSAGAVDFNPFRALAWLANDRAKRGDPLRAGQFVATGDFIGAIDAGPGSVVEADFGPLGRLRLDLMTR